MADQNEAAPAAAAPAAAPAPETTPAAAPAPAAAPEPAPSTPPAPAAGEKAPAAPAAASSPEAKPASEPSTQSEPTLLEQATQKPEAKPEAKPGEKPAEAKPEAQPEPVKVDPVAYEYTLPETLKMDDEQRGAFHGALDAFRQDPAKGAQGLVDLHNDLMKQYAEHLVSEQWRIFNDTRKEWRTQAMADEQIGGAGHQTAMGAIARMRDSFLSRHQAGTPQYEADAKEFDQFLRTTGAGDHPAFLKFLHNVARRFDEPPMPPPGAKPPPNNGRRPGDKRSVLYDRSPASPQR